MKAWDAEGGKLDRSKLDLAAAWDDGGTGVNALPVAEDPRTTVALHRARYWQERQKYLSLTVVSDGWTLGDALPERAEVEVEGGETWEVPVIRSPVTRAGDPTFQTVPPRATGGTPAA